MSIDSPISCSSNGDTSNSCCYENPGGIILFTQFWDYNPASGPADSFTIHSIWNDYCSGGYPQFCDTSLKSTVLVVLLSRLLLTSLEIKLCMTI